MEGNEYTGMESLVVALFGISYAIKCKNNVFSTRVLSIPHGKVTRAPNAHLRTLVSPTHRKVELALISCKPWGHPSIEPLPEIESVADNLSSRIND